MSSLAEALASLVSGENLAKRAAEVADARDHMIPSTDDEDVQAIHSALVHNRAQIERVQAIAASLVLYKAKASKQYREAQAVYDDAYAKAAVKPQVGFSDYSTAKEKDSYYGSQIVGETMALRVAENIFRDAEAVTEFVRVVLRGMEGSHRDLETRVRLISLRGQLDR